MKDPFSLKNLSRILFFLALVFIGVGVYLLVNYR